MSVSALSEPDLAPPPATAAEFCERYAASVHRFAYMLSRDPESALDLAQDVLERAIRTFGSFDPSQGNAEGWLWKVALNVARDAGRASKRRDALILRAMTMFPRPPQPAPSAPPGVSDLDLMRAVRRLSARHRTVIALRFGSDRVYAAIGSLLGVSSPAAKMALRRALDALRLTLKTQHTDPKEVPQ